MASEIGSGDLDAITPTRMISALFGMVIRLKTHVQSMVNHGTGVSRASAWAITPAKITVTANILHQIGTKADDERSSHRGNSSYLAGRSAPHGSNLSDESRYMSEDSR